MKPTFSYAFLVLGLTCAASAHAGAEASARAASAADDYVLTYSANDFQTVDTVKALYQRIRSLARGHCPDYFRTRDLPGTSRCVDDVVNDLITSIGHPALSAYGNGSGDEGIRVALEAIDRSDQG